MEQGGKTDFGVLPEVTDIQMIIKPVLVNLLNILLSLKGIRRVGD